MDGASTDEDSAREAADPPPPQRERTDEPAENPAVAAAKAIADSRIEKARIARHTALVRDLWVGGPIVTIGFFFTVWVIIVWINYNADPIAYDKPLIHWGWGVVSAVIAVLTMAAGGIRQANRKAAFVEVVLAEDFNVRAAALDTSPETDAPLAANRALLQEYHRLSTNQARSAFGLAQWVMGTAAVLVLAGAVAVAFAHDTATSVTLASLTAFVTALSGYISSTLLATYRVSVEQARFYFREPLAGGYLLAAEHLAKRLDPPEHTAALGRVVDGFIQAAVNTPESAPAASQQAREKQEDAPERK
ncbi:hypothetical protein [Streptomyces mirabilis]|uniref:hypothetical protein n=1 Tax=Streptomyces mirabilis TaxID=68239 RepID=UPI0036C9A20B